MGNTGLRKTGPLRLHVPCLSVNYKRFSFLKIVATVTWISAPIKKGNIILSCMFREEVTFAG